MKKLENLKDFKIDEAQQQLIKGGIYILNQASTTQVGGGYCSGLGADCQDAIYNDDGGVIGWGDPDYDQTSPNGC